MVVHSGVGARIELESPTPLDVAAGSRETGRAMRVTHWLLGIVLGAFVGGFVLEAGVLALLLLVPVLVWSAREAQRPFGLSGAALGVGAGFGGLLALADIRCAADVSCSMPDQTGYLAVAAVLVAAGGALAVVAARGSARTSSG